jgi:two-component system chemotaxis response regulator CheY
MITSLNILVAEDDIETRNSLVSDLKWLGFNSIIEAEDGVQALGFFNNPPDGIVKFDIIISDMVMPNASGLELILNIRSIDIKKTIPFLMLTSKSDKDTIIQCVKAGVTSYLLKPWSKQSLSEKIAFCISKIKESK